MRDSKVKFTTKARVVIVQNPYGTGTAVVDNTPWVQREAHSPIKRIVSYRVLATHG